MDSELNGLSHSPHSHSNLEDGPIKDDLPLLKNSSKPTTSDDDTSTPHPDIQELEKKYAAYVRHDVYGTMGRGNLPWTQKLLLGIALITLFPLRIVLATLVVVLYYLICRACTLCLVPNREDEQEDYAHMGGWRRTIIYWVGRLLSRALLFVIGFYWIKETYRNPDLDNKFNHQLDENGELEECERPGAIISNHVSHLDILYHMSSSFPSFVAKRSVSKLPLIGLIRCSIMVIKATKGRHVMHIVLLGIECG